MGDHHYQQQDARGGSSQKRWFFETSVIHDFIKVIIDHSEAMRSAPTKVGLKTKFRQSMVFIVGGDRSMGSRSRTALRRSHFRKKALFLQGPSLIVRGRMANKCGFWRNSPILIVKVVSECQNGANIADLAVAIRGRFDTN